MTCRRKGVLELQKASRDRTNEVREERRVKPDEGRSFAEVVRVWMLSVLSTWNKDGSKYDGR
jgi:hypothetical protein